MVCPPPPVPTPVQTVGVTVRRGRGGSPVVSPDCSVSAKMICLHLAAICVDALKDTYPAPLRVFMTSAAPPPPGLLSSNRRGAILLGLCGFDNQCLASCLVCHGPSMPTRKPVLPSLPRFYSYAPPPQRAPPPGGSSPRASGGLATSGFWPSVSTEGCSGSVRTNRVWIVTIQPAAFCAAGCGRQVGLHC